VQEGEAEDALLDLQSKLVELQSQLSDAVGRLARIRRIKRSVRERGAQASDRVMEELDKEDGVLPALEAHERHVVGDLQALGVPNEVDWSSLGIGDFDGMGPLLGGLGFEDSNAAAVRGPSVG
jgi:hypothetical protein